MRRFIPLLFLFVSCSLFAKSSVWRVSKEGKSFYLGGACHLLRSSDYPLPAEFELAYSVSDTLVVELNIETVQKPSFTMDLINSSRFSGSDTLESTLSKRTYKVLAKSCDESGFSIQTLNQIKPGTAVMMLIVRELTRFGVTQEGVDVHYYKRSLRDKKRILTLETAESQLELISSLGDNLENDTIKYGLKEIDHINDNFYSMTNSWKTGDLKKINKYFTANLSKYPKLYSKLLVDRNNRWVKSLGVLTNTPEIEFVIVNVSHIAGKKGLIALLEKEGYTIEQIGISL